jgi:hypothetical protein
MAETTDGKPNLVTVEFRLTPTQKSDQPILANVSKVIVFSGMAYLDFGFLEPAVTKAALRMARNGSKRPPTVNGKLAVRVALDRDATVQLYRQIGRAIGVGPKQGKISEGIRFQPGGPRVAH